MNKQGKNKIDWCDFTANPIDGFCLYACKYCYANAIRKRFKMKNEITFRENWFDKKQADKFVKENKKSPRIFIGSMHDIFGNWIKREWINKIIEIVKENSQCDFYFLTKNPERYLDFEFPDNCWLGFTMTSRYFSQRRKLGFLKTRPNKKFISLEPLFGPMDEIDFDGIDLIIVGAQTGPGAVKPEREWIESIKHPNIYFKKNIKKYL